MHVLPLGGAGEIGLNCTAYETGGRWLVVDCGVLFRDPDAPLADLILPDVRFLAARRDAASDRRSVRRRRIHSSLSSAFSPAFFFPFPAGFTSAFFVGIGALTDVRQAFIFS